MGRRRRALSLLLLAGAPVLHAQVPAQATVLALRGIRATADGVAVAFDVRDGRGAIVPGLAAPEVQVWASGRPVSVARLDARVPTCHRLGARRHPPRPARRVCRRAAGVRLLGR